MTSAPVTVGRPPSEQLVDLHVYLVPKEAWNEKYRSAYNDVIDQTISAGFVRVWPELSLYYLRNQILEQLGYDVLPTEYVFLRSVGRCLTQVKSRQEFELKVKNFIPPQTPLPEIFVMEAKRDPLNLASFTNHERIEVLEEETISPLMEESKGTGNNRTPESDAENTGTRHADSTSKQSRQKLSKIPRRVHPAGLKMASRQTSRQTGRQAVVKTGVRAEKLSSTKAEPAGRKQAGLRVGVVTRIGRQQAAAGSSGAQVARKSRLAGDKPPRPTAGATRVPVRGRQARFTQDGVGSTTTGTKAAGRRETSRGTKHKEGKVAPTQEGKPHPTQVQGSWSTRAGLEHASRAGINRIVRTEQESTAGDTAGQSKDRSARTSTNPPSEASSSAHWAIPQTYRAFHDEHQPSTCGTTPTPSQIPNITPGGVPPLNLHHLDAVKGMDPSTPLKSGRPDTYTNNTNEDSGIAEFTPDRNELDYGRQRSDSLERKQMAEKQQTPRTFEVNPKGRPEGLDSRLHSAEPEPLDRAHLQDSARQHPAPDNAAAVQEAERLREEERARQRERQIQEATAQEQAERQRQLESARRREAERWEKEKQEEEERQRLLKARQQELEMQRRQALAAQEAAAAQQAAATAKEKEEAAAALQQRLQDEAEERELEEEIRRRQADELRQSRQMSWDQARRRELEGVTPLSQRAGSSQQKDLYGPHARDSVRKEYTGDLSDRKTVGGGSTRQSERTQDSALLLDDAGSSVASNRDGTSAGEASEKTRQTTESAKERLETERERLIAELHERQTVRFDLERTREELMRQAKMLQSRTNDRRNKARDYWKKRYFEEKKKTNPLEEQVNRLRIQLDQQHRKLLNQLEGRGPNRRGMPREPPSKKNDHKILIFKLKHQIDDLKRRVENSKMKLTSEIKLRNQAETELRNLRSDVMQRKINVTVSRSQQLTTLKELEEKQGVRTTPLRGTGATSYTPRGTVKIGLK